MPEIRHLPRAPITEAVIDFRVDSDPASTVDALILAVEQRGNFGYDKKGAIVSGEFGFSLMPDESKSLAGRTTTIGVRLHSRDEKYVALLSIGGFTLSRLQPYESWENLVREAKRLWTGYLECVAVSRIVRAGTRYINNLRLPPGSLDRYLMLQPSLPEGVGLPQVMSAFFQRFVLYDAPSEATVILTQALEVTTLDQPLPVILDIDAFRPGTFAPHGPQAWDCLERLRDVKNRVFFGCLTETSIELYV